MSRTSTGSSSPPEPAPLVPDSAPGVRAQLAALDVRPARRLGQSFLVDPFVADVEAALADAGPGTPVLEVGGGLGILTAALLRREVRELTVVERDARLAEHLVRTFGDRIRVVVGDALEQPFDDGTTVVGNLPFSVGTPILQRVFRSPAPRFVGMLQREVAERLAAVPGSRSYGRPTIEAALYGDIELHQIVPSRSFEPAPEVEGRILSFTRRAGPLPVRSVPRLEQVVAALFSSRRKQLGNLLARALPAGELPAAAAQAAGWPEDWARRRPEELPPEAFFRLADLLEARDAAPGRARARTR